MLLLLSVCCTCIYVCVYIYIYIYTHTYIHMCTYTYSSVCVHTCMRACAPAKCAGKRACSILTCCRCLLQHWDATPMQDKRACNVLRMACFNDEITIMIILIMITLIMIIITIWLIILVIIVIVIDKHWPIIVSTMRYTSARCCKLSLSLADANTPARKRASARHPGSLARADCHRDVQGPPVRGPLVICSHGQFSEFQACFCGLDSGNLKFETVRTHKQHVCF